MSVRAVSFNTNDYCLAAASTDRVIRYWDLDQNFLINSSACDSVPADRLCFSRDGKQVMAANCDNVKCYDMEQNRLLDIVMKPHRKIFDMKVSDTELFIVDEQNGAIAASSIPLNILNKDPDCEVAQFGGGGNREASPWEGRMNMMPGRTGG